MHGAAAHPEASVLWLSRTSLDSHVDAGKMGDEILYVLIGGVDGRTIRKYEWGLPQFNNYEEAVFK